MAYEPTDWVCGDTVTADRLNKLEEGVADIMSEYVPTEWQCGDIVTAERLNKLEQAVAEASEGGSNDFSTAQVMVINNSELDPFALRIPNICEANELGEGSPAMIYNFMICPVGESTHKVRMYKGLAYCTEVSYPSDSPVSTTGDIVIDGDRVFITGDCTITIS